MALQEAELRSLTALRLAKRQAARTERLVKQGMDLLLSAARTGDSRLKRVSACQSLQLRQLEAPLHPLQNGVKNC